MKESAMLALELNLTEENKVGKIGIIYYYNLQGRIFVNHAEVNI